MNQLYWACWCSIKGMVYLFVIVKSLEEPKDLFVIAHIPCENSLTEKKLSGKN